MKEVIKLSAAFVCVSICIMLVGCGSKEDIMGYWVSCDNRYSVTFSEENAVTVDGKYIGEYQIYHEGKVAINVDTATFDDVYDLVMSAEYEVSDGRLTLTDLDSGQTWFFYSENKIPTSKNIDYSNRYKKYSGTKKENVEYDYLGYWDDNNNLVKDFDWELEETNMTLDVGRKESDSIFKKEILSLYQEAYPELKFITDNSGLISFDGIIYNVLVLSCEGQDTISVWDRYAVNPLDGSIYIYDCVEDSYDLWDGTIIEGESLLQEI